MGLFSRKNADADTGLAARSQLDSQPGAGSSSYVEVRATDGPMPDTREQFQAIRAAGGSSVDVALTATDLVADEELLGLVELEIQELAKQSDLEVRITRR